MNIPGFLARQFYVAGSLRNTETGFQLQAQNPMGSGTIVGVGQLRIDGHDIPAETVTAQRSFDDQAIRAADVSKRNPVNVAKGDQITLHVEAEPLSAGEHQLEVELYEINVGRLKFSISDTVSDSNS